jgi:hypothetical protein
MGGMYMIGGLLCAFGIFGDVWDSLFLSDLFGDTDGEWETSPVARLFGLPTAALGFLCFLRRNNVEFVKATVTGRVIFGGIGIPLQYLIFDDTPFGLLFLWFLDLVPALIAFLDMKQQGCYDDDFGIKKEEAEATDEEKANLLKEKEKEDDEMTRVKTEIGYQGIQAVREESVRS